MTITRLTQIMAVFSLLMSIVISGFLVTIVIEYAYALDIFEFVAAATIFIFAVFASVVSLIIWQRMKGLKRLAAAAEEIARGNIAVNLQAEGIDEISRIAASFQLAIVNIQMLNRNVSELEDAIKHGVLSYRIDNPGLHGSFGEIANKFNNVVGEFCDVFNFMTEPLIVTDANFKIMFANEIIKKFTHRDGQDALGMHVNDFLNDDLVGLDAMVKAKKTGQPQLEVWIGLQLNPEQYFDLELNCIPFGPSGNFGSDGEIYGYILLITNLTHIAEINRRAEKQDKYRQERIERLTSNIVSAFGEGNLTIDFAPSAYDEDTKEIALAMDDMETVVLEAVGTVKSYVDEICSILQGIAANNFDFDIGRGFAGDFSTISNSLKAIGDSVGALIGEIQSSSTEVGLGASSISQSSQVFMSSFEGQTAIMSEVTDAANKLVEKANKNADDAKNANRLSVKVQDIAIDGSHHMTEMSTAMDEIIQSSKEIAKVVGIIESIAFQTNLLALNASVEAARAGAHGKGFAVVAEEVRSLAARSATAAKDTSEMLTKSLGRVDFGAAKTVQTAGALRSIVEAAAVVAEAVANIVAASDEQVGEVSKIRKSIEDVHVSVQQDIVTVQGNVSISKELSSQAQSLMELASQFKIKK